MEVLPQQPASGEKGLGLLRGSHPLLGVMAKTMGLQHGALFPTPHFSQPMSMPGHTQTRLGERNRDGDKVDVGEGVRVRRVVRQLQLVVARDGDLGDPVRGCVYRCACIVCVCLLRGTTRLDLVVRDSRGTDKKTGKRPPER